MVRIFLVCLLALVAVSPARAGAWADALFEELNKDFGSVPRGPSLTHLFRLTNKTTQPVHISGLRVSCGCVTAVALEHHLPPGKSTAIQVVMDTRRFYGFKSVTVYVTFDQPQVDEVRLWVQANSRDDLMVTPEILALGQHKRGTTPSGSVTVTFYGNDQWRITGVQKESNYLQPELKEVRRQGVEVVYQLTVTVRQDVPVGRWYSDLWLLTNNPALPKVRIPLTVEIQSALSVSPQTVQLGQVKIGTEAERRVLVRGAGPFKITGVLGTDDSLSVQNTTSEARPVHVLVLKLKPRRAGERTWNLRVQTDLKEEGEIEFQARAQVVAAGN